ncbi:MAG: BA14K family protein [Pseudolabrys sp.]|jgi:hypothetical protein
MVLMTHRCRSSMSAILVIGAGTFYSFPAPAMELAMKKTTLAIAVAMAAITGALSVPTTADARCHGCAVGAGIAAGVIGGAIIGSAIANSRHAPPPYYDDPPRYHHEYDRDDDAVEYCMERFKSYDPRSGTYMGYDGYRHPCP